MSKAGCLKVLGKRRIQPGGVAQNEGRYQRPRLLTTISDSLPQSVANLFDKPEPRRRSLDDDW
jgi:hypothetical protein